MTMLAWWRKNFKMRKLNIAQEQLHQHHHYIYDYLLQRENIRSAPFQTQAHQNP